MGNRMREWSDEDVAAQLRRYNSGEDEPPWQGAVPDTDKLEASVQTDPYGLWWRGTACDFCVYEAEILIEGN
jgi:hypothetical protein